MTSTNQSSYGESSHRGGLPIQLGDWQRYWVGLLRILVGWWLTTGTASAPFWAREIFLWVASSPDLLALVNLGIPLIEAMIGLALIIGLLTKLAAFGGATLMFFFYFGNAGWLNGFINADLMGLILFVTIIVFDAGRVWGIDRYIEATAFVESHPRLRYIVG